MIAPIWFIIGGVAALVLGGIAFSRYQKKRRTEAWRRTADDLGLVYFGAANDVLARFGQFRTLTEGRSRKILEGIRADAGDTEILVADFRHTVSNGQHSHTKVRTVCIVTDRTLCMPQCRLRPQVMLFDMLGKMLGGQDINFDDDPGFSKAYVLQGAHEASIRDAFAPELRAWFTARRGKSMHFEAQGTSFLFHTTDRQTPEKTKDRIREALELLGLMPRAEQDAKED